jgi:hypothetical protein
MRNIPVFDLNVVLSSTFVDAVAAVVQSPVPQLALIHTVTRNFRDLVLRDYLRKLAIHARSEGGRPVSIIDHSTTAGALDALFLQGMAGRLVLMGELVPGASGFERSVTVAAQLVSKGATVIAAIHALTAQDANLRLAQLWSARENLGMSFDLSKLSVQVIAFDVGVEAHEV